MGSPGFDPLAAVTPRLDGREFRWSVGVRPLDLANWLQVDGQRHDDLRAKDRILADQHAEVVVTQPAGLPGARELLVTLNKHLLRYHPDKFEVADQVVTDRDSGRVVSFSHDHPIDTAGRTVAEDFAILTRDSEAWRLTAASICFPSQWRPRDKIGHDLAAIHGPVPLYRERLEGAVDQLFDRLTPNSPVTRTNWTITNTDELHLCGPHTPRPMPAGADPGSALWVRTERQTLRQLPQTKAVAFTILTRLCRLSELPIARRRQLAQTLKTVPFEIAEYKGWQDSVVSLITWCER